MNIPVFVRLADPDWSRGAIVTVVLGIIVLCGGFRECRVPESSQPRLRVALRVEQTRTDQPATYLVPADTLGVVRTDPMASTTLVSRSARGLVAALRQGLDARQTPVTTTALEVVLPEAPAALSGIPLDILLFADANTNGQWDPGEPYVSAWQGGRGSYRVVHFGTAAEQPEGSRRGWNLLEGGSPSTYHALSDHLVTINPVVEPVERR